MRFSSTLSLLIAFILTQLLLAANSQPAKNVDLHVGSGGPPNIAGPADSAGIEFFETKVRPALAKYCYECHSQSSSKAMGGLTLDSRKGMTAGGKMGPVLAAFAPDSSKLIEAVKYKNPDMQMPPSGKIPDPVIADLASWIRMGAPWPETKSAPPDKGKDLSQMLPAAISQVEFQKLHHWSWQPLRNPQPPKVKHAGWPKNSLDNFILAKLESKGITPSPYADRRTLIRRAYFDLIGLPPTPEEAAAFIADKAPDAWAKVIDHLLASPHYGERWGRYWLDLARYGEDQAHSFEPRLYPQGFRYRDWVANALNSDMPYDQFLKEQIAADLLPEPDKQARLPALGFFALGPVYYGDGKMFDQYDDRVDTLSRSVLGLTVACARCHDHKYDPISQKDYYALAGVFADSNYIESPIADAANKADGATGTTGTIVNRNDAINKKSGELDKFVIEQQGQFRNRLTPEISRYIDACWRLRNRKKSDPKVTLETIAASEKLDSVFLERWDKYLERPPDNDHNEAQLAIWRKLIKDEDPKVDLSTNSEAAAAAHKIAVDIQTAVEGLIQRSAAADKQKPNSAKVASDKITAPSKSEMAFLEEINGSEGVLTVPQDKLEALLSGDSKLRFGILTAELNRLKMGSFVHALTDAPKPVNLPVLARGNPDTPGAEEPRHFLTILCSGGAPTPFKSSSGRLELANAITDRSNPLTPRVIVNRVWQHHFGVGIVRTASNFGMLGEPPTNPELLDYLTSRFVQGGWTLKSLHRMIMLSAAYQMTSASDAHKAELDPDNHFVWRMPRRRLEVEAWRDSMLTVEGTLDLTLGGPSLQLSSADNHRRTYYAAVSRHDLDSMLRLFDFPDPNATIDVRMTTTVPLQQLFVLNSAYMIRQAKAFAARLNSGPASSDADRVKHAFALAYNRVPTPAELSLALNFLAGPKAMSSTAIVSTVSQSQLKKTDSLTKWEQYAQVILSSNEFMYVD